MPGDRVSFLHDGFLGVIRRHPVPLFAAVFCLSLVTRIYFTRNVAYRPGADEGVYLGYARVIGHEGLQSLPSLTGAYLKDEPGVWPPPTRIGFVIPAALAMRALGDGTPLPLTYVSTLMFAGFVLLAFWFVRRNGSPDLAFITGVLLAFSPLLTGLSRRAVTDSTVAFLTLALIVSFYELMVRERRSAADAVRPRLALAPAHQGVGLPRLSGAPRPGDRLRVPPWIRPATTRSSGSSWRPRSPSPARSSS